ncbi:hypothetical protein BASA83_012498 [Batrachochytrium salamandrivorans]|nr:hypothetical protein BASA83_012498 [Batrachochytrium salamandrivorans]
MIVSWSPCFPPTTLAQREVILSNVEAFTMWANYDSKILNYGPASTHSLPSRTYARTLKQLLTRTSSLVTDAFTMIRDHHTRWINVAPYSCFYLPPELDFPLSGDVDIAKNPTVVVTSTSTNPKTVQSGGGANEFGGQRSALRFLSTRYGETNRLPSEDSITFKFNPELTPKTAILSMSRMSLDTMMNVGVWKPDSANMGVINLEDFSPEDIDTNNPVSLKAIMIVRSLLANELKDTNSVIYELRGNPGGIVSFSDGMVQLFKPDFHPFGGAI